LIKIKKKSTDMTLKEAVDKYIESLENRLKDRSKEQYEYIRDKRFQSIMPLKLSDITKDKLDKAVEDELAKPSRKGGTLSAKTVRDAYMLVASVMHKYAPDTETQVRLPEIQRTFPDLVPPDQIVAAIMGTDIELPCLLARKNCARVHWISHHTLKSSLMPFLMTLLKLGVVTPYTCACKSFSRPLGYRTCVFTTSDINASIMADLNIPTSVAQERGGWKTDNTMKRVYTHTFDSSRREADKKIDAYFDKLISDKMLTKSVEWKNPQQNQRV